MAINVCVERRVRSAVLQGKGTRELTWALSKACCSADTGQTCPDSLPAACSLPTSRLHYIAMHLADSDAREPYIGAGEVSSGGDTTECVWGYMPCMLKGTAAMTECR